MRCVQVGFPFYKTFRFLRYLRLSTNLSATYEQITWDRFLQMFGYGKKKSFLKSTVCSINIWTSGGRSMACALLDARSWPSDRLVLPLSSPFHWISVIFPNCAYLFSIQDETSYSQETLSAPKLMLILREAESRTISALMSLRCNARDPCNCRGTHSIYNWYVKDRKVTLGDSSYQMSNKLHAPKGKESMRSLDPDAFDLLSWSKVNIDITTNVLIS